LKYRKWLVVVYKGDTFLLFGIWRRNQQTHHGPSKGKRWSLSPLPNVNSDFLLFFSFFFRSFFLTTDDTNLSIESNIEILWSLS
jgi:hypothetical protein